MELGLAEAQWAAGDPAAALAACERSEAALETVPGEPALRARVLAAIAGGLVMTGQYDRGRAVAERAIVLADESGATRSQLQARITLATAIARQGDLHVGVAELRQCLSEAVGGDAFKAVVRCYGNLAFLHAAAGRLGEVLEIATEGARRPAEVRPPALVAPTLAENWVHALVATGRWDEAAEVAHDLQQQWAAEGMALALHVQLAQVAAARGSETDFERQMSIIDGFARPDDPYTVHDVTAARAEHLLWQGDADEAHRITRARWTSSPTKDGGLVVSMCSLALRAHADLVTSRADRLLSSRPPETAQPLAAARRRPGRDRRPGPRLPACVRRRPPAPHYPFGLRLDAGRRGMAAGRLRPSGGLRPVATGRGPVRRPARAQGTRALATALQTATHRRAPLEDTPLTLATCRGGQRKTSKEPTAETAAPAPPRPRPRPRCR